jgi:hypothetical protein
MALIVEDGTGLATAESYISVVDAGTYCTAHGLTAWTGTDAVKEAALRNATQYIDTSYNFRSAKSYQYQALEFPRQLWDWDDDPLMTRLRAATVELAVKALTASLFADVEPSVVTMVKVGPITKQTTPVDHAGQKRYAAIDALLKQLTTGLGGVQVVRA